MNLEEASQCRSCVGILLYLATDLPHCQHVMRWLSTGTATPASKKNDVLRHLVSYLHGTKGLCLCLHYKGDNVGVHHQYFKLCILRCIQILSGLQISQIVSQCQEWDPV